MNDPVTPADLSRELGVSQKRIRDFLRAEYGKLGPHQTRWLLTEPQVVAVNAHFRELLNN